MGIYQDVLDELVRDLGVTIDEPAPAKPSKGGSRKALEDGVERAKASPGQLVYVGRVSRPIATHVHYGRVQGVTQEAGWHIAGRAMPIDAKWCHLWPRATEREPVDPIGWWKGKTLIYPEGPGEHEWVVEEIGHNKGTPVTVARRLPLPWMGSREVIDVVASEATTEEDA